MSEPTKEQKLDIIRKYMAGETILTLSQETGFETKIIREWVRLYRRKGEAGLEPKKKLTGFLLGVMLVVSAAVIGLSALKIAETKKEYKIGADSYTALAEAVVQIDPPKVSDYEINVTVTSEQTEEKEDPVIDVSNPSIHVDFEALSAINSQVIAWISSADGSINYPVARGTDNEYYLNHLIDGTVNRNGSLFMDFRNEKDFSDKNTFIYGHNMLDGTMFASLCRYSEAGYYEKYPTMLLVTPEKSYSLQVFAGCVVPGNSDIYQLSFSDDADYHAYLQKIRKLSEFSSSVEVEQNDQIVTLSTCTYSYEDARYVLFCKLMPME